MGFLNVVTLAEDGSGSDPSGAEEGVPLDGGVRSYRVILAAPSGETLDGSGAFKVFYRSPEVGWAQSHDLGGDIPPEADGQSAIVILEREIGPSRGRMRVVLDGVGFSSGTEGRVIYELGN